jgi:hypothetical protein
MGAAFVFAVHVLVEDAGLEVLGEEDDAELV